MRKSVHIAVGILFLFLISCSDTISNSVNDKTLTLSYIVEDLETRSLNTTVAERSLEDIIFVFYQVNTDEFVTYTIGSILSNEKRITLPLSNKIESDEKYKVLILGNTKNYKFQGKSLRQFIIDNSNLSFDSMREKLIISSMNDAPLSPELPLRGKLLGLDGEPLYFVYSEKSEVPFSIRFSQIVSRFNVINTAYGILDIESIKVCNYKPSGYFFESTEFSDVSVVSGLDNSKFVAEKAVIKDGMQTFVDGGLYAFPNRVPYVVPNDKETTCLLIAGYYHKKGSDANTKNLSYYRVNVGEVGKSQVLESNHLYTVVINNVKNSGSATQEEAMNQKESSFDYTIIENWETADNNTVSSSDGRFITLSERMVVLDSEANVSELIRVLVKPGDTWTATWKPNSGHSEKAFNIQMLNTRSFHITTLEQNLSEGLNKGVITIKLDKSDLSMDLYVYQYSCKGVGPLLIVDGKTEDFDVQVDGEGELLSFEVLTGTYSGWEAEFEGDLGEYATLIRASGANMSSFQIEFKPNVRRNFIREASVLITRKDKNPAIPDVRINFFQKHTEKLIEIYPNLSESGLELDGFSTSKAYRTGGIAHIVRFRVELTDPEMYDFEIHTTNFEQYLDAFAFIENDDLEEYQPYYDLRSTYSFSNSEQDDLKLPDYSIGTSGSTVSFCVFRTGPGDENLPGNLVFTAIPKDNTMDGYVKQEIVIPVNIFSNCKIGDVIIDNCYIPDRNCGTPSKDIEKEALNYSTLSFHKDQTNRHKLFKGKVFKEKSNNPVDDTVCEEFQKANYGVELDFKLRIPKIDFHTLLDENYYISKERVYLLSEESLEGEHIGAYLPYAHFYMKDKIEYLSALWRSYVYILYSPREIGFSRFRESRGPFGYADLLLRCVGYLK